MQNLPFFFDIYSIKTMSRFIGNNKLLFKLLFQYDMHYTYSVDFYSFPSIQIKEQLFVYLFLNKKKLIRRKDKLLFQNESILENQLASSKKTAD
jgi:hypothetical protein